MSERGQLQIITTKILCHKLTSSCLLGSVTALPITCRLFLFCRVLVSNLSLSAKIYVKIKIWCSLILVQSVQNCLSFEMHVQPPQTRNKLCTAVILFNWAHLIGCKCKAVACIVCMGTKKSQKMLYWEVFHFLSNKTHQLVFVDINSVKFHLEFIPVYTA